MANIYMASALNRHYADKGIVGLSLRPGMIVTTETAEDLAHFGDMSRLVPTFKSMEQGAATTVWVAVSPHFEGENGGKYLADVGECGLVAKDAEPGDAGYAPHLYDEEAEEKLWKISCDAMGGSDD